MSWDVFFMKVPDEVALSRIIIIESGEHLSNKRRRYMLNNFTTLLFPQWQGSGTKKDLYHGAMKIKERYLSDRDYREVNVSLCEGLVEKNNILGYDVIREQLQNAVELLFENDYEKIFTIGGDCGVELAPVSYLNEKYNGDMAVIWFDAHGDLNTPSSSPSKKFHGMPLRTLLGEGDEPFIRQCFSLLTTEQIILAGCRELDLPEQQYIDKSNITLVSIEDMAGSSKLIDAVKEKGHKKIYIHLDLDALDPDCFPAVMCPACKGMSVDNLVGLLKKLNGNFDVVGFSIVEYAPTEGQYIEELKKIIDCFQGGLNETI